MYPVFFFYFLRILIITDKMEFNALKTSEEENHEQIF